MLPSCVPATGFDESGAVLRSDDLEPFMSLPVIPKLKITTKGLIDVNKQEIVSLFAY